MDEQNKYANRADQMGDVFRRYLVGLNTGGIVILMQMMMSEQLGRNVSRYMKPSFWFFFIGLLIIGGSIYLQKHKAIQKGKAVGNDAKLKLLDNKFRKKRWSNTTYDVAALACFLIGALVILGNLR